MDKIKEEIKNKRKKGEIKNKVQKVSKEPVNNTPFKIKNKEAHTKMMSTMVGLFKNDNPFLYLQKNEKMRRTVKEAFFRTFIDILFTFQYLNGTERLKTYNLDSSLIDSIMNLSTDEDKYKHIHAISTRIEEALFALSDEDVSKDSTYFTKSKMLSIYLKKPEKELLQFKVLTGMIKPEEFCNFNENDLICKKRKEEIERVNQNFMRSRQIEDKKIILKTLRDQTEFELEEQKKERTPSISVKSYKEDNNKETVEYKDQTDDGYDFEVEYNKHDYKKYLVKKINEMLCEDSSNRLIAKLDKIA